MSSTKNFKQTITKMANASDAYAILQSLVYVANNQPMASFGITNGAGALVFKTGNAGLAVAAGVLQKVASAANFSALTGLSIPISSKALVVLTVDANGNLNSYFSPVSTAVAGCLFPDLPLGVAILGACLIENGSAGVFTGGTTALDTAGITLTFGQSPGPLAPVPYV